MSVVATLAVLSPVSALALSEIPGAGAPAHRPGPSGQGAGSARGPAASVRYWPAGCRVSGPRVAYRSGPARKVVALSFDDGPYPLSASFMRMLAANHVPATFFLIGRQVTAAYRSTLIAELRRGDVLGDHTWSHPDLILSGALAGQLTRTAAAIRTMTGYSPCLFRPPYGAYDAAIVRTARSLGMATILWNVDPVDWSQPGVAAIEERILAQVRPGSIVLSHDGGGPRQQTLAAYPRVIAVLRARGYSFQTVPQLLGFRAVYRRCQASCPATATAALPPRGSIIE